MNNHLISFEKDENMYLKAKTSPHTTRILRLKYIFLKIKVKILSKPL